MEVHGDDHGNDRSDRNDHDLDVRLSQSETIFQRQRQQQIPVDILLQGNPSRDACVGVSANAFVEDMERGWMMNKPDFGR